MNTLVYHTRLENRCRRYTPPPHADSMSPANQLKRKVAEGKFLITYNALHINTLHTYETQMKHVCNIAQIPLQREKWKPTQTQPDL